eukprot:611831-Pelagomonas_calceolata.AAC.1
MFSPLDLRFKTHFSCIDVVASAILRLTTPSPQCSSHSFFSSSNPQAVSYNARTMLPSLQDEVDNALSQQRCSHSYSASPASSPRLLPNPSRESLLRQSSELFLWRAAAQQPAVQMHGSGGKQEQGEGVPSAEGGYGSERQLGTGRRRSGDSARSIEGQGGKRCSNGSRQGGGSDSKEEQQNHDHPQQQQQEQPPAVMADALQDRLFSE